MKSEGFPGHWVFLTLILTLMGTIQDKSKGSGILMLH